MNSGIIQNYSLLKPRLFILPVFLLAALIIFLYTHDALNINGYIHIQERYFISINSTLSAFPEIMFNITQLGDALIFLSLLSVLLIYAPVIWESLLSASLITLLVSALLKNFFAVPRPAAFLNNNSFVIIGEKLPGHSSLPSGHSITIFTTLTVLLFAFIPHKTNQRFWWFFLFVVTGLSMSFTRVGIGAHYPLDVLVGATVGYLCGLSGIFFSRRFKAWAWMSNKKYYPVLFLLLIMAGFLLISRIMDQHLPIFYLALASLIFSLYKITDVYFTK